MSYCSGLTDQQLRNVYQDEKDRVKRYRQSGSRDPQAEELLREAELEMAKRGLSAQ